MLTNQKHLFSLNDDVRYLNCAYKAPLLKSSENAAMQALKKERNPADLKPDDFFKNVTQVREEFGKLIHAKPSDVAIIPSTSYGFASVLNNVTYHQGQHAITIENEFPSDYFSIKRWCETHHAKLKVVRPARKKKRLGKNWNNRLIESINTRTAVVIISSVHWMTGMKFDLKRIGEKCRSVGAAFIVDGTQSVGAIPMDVNKFNIDALVCASYKWMFGPYSVGLAYIGERFHGGKPLEESWMNRINAKNFSNLTTYEEAYWPDAGRFNVGQTSNFICMPMMLSGLRQLNSWTVEAIQEYCNQLILPLRNYLENFGIAVEKEAYSSDHILGFQLPDTMNMDQLRENFGNHGIIASIRGNYLRIAVHVFNTEKDIAKLIEVIEATRVTVN